MTAPLPERVAEALAERERIASLLGKSTGEAWYFQTGWGIQYWIDTPGGKAVGLLVPDGHEGSATVPDMDLMAASQDIARTALVALALVVEQAEGLAGAEARLARVEAALDEHYPGWGTEYESQEAFEESAWQSDRAQEAALPAICAIRAALDGDA